MTETEQMRVEEAHNGYILRAADRRRSLYITAQELLDIFEFALLNVSTLRSEAAAAKEADKEAE